MDAASAGERPSRQVATKIELALYCPPAIRFPEPSVMNIDWAIATQFAAPISTLFIGIWLNRRFESRPSLISYFGHVAAFQYQPPGGQLVHVHTHSVVLRNTGRRSATNIRLHHAVLPDFTIWPQVQHSVVTLPNGSKDIVVPALIPGEQISVSYLYFPPVTYEQVNAGIKSDQGFAHAIPVLLQRQYPKWFNVTVAIVLSLGLLSVVYVLFLGIAHLLR
jgi:hypothetical protein